MPRVKGCPYPNLAIAASAGALARRHVSPAVTSAATLFIGCLKGKRRYFPVLYINGAKKEYRKAAARPGDKVVLTVREDSTSAVVSVVDKTRSSVSRKLTGSGANSFGKTWTGDLVATNGRLHRAVPELLHERTR